MTNGVGGLSVYIIIIRLQLHMPLSDNAREGFFVQNEQVKNWVLARSRHGTQQLSRSPTDYDYVD